MSEPSREKGKASKARLLSVAASEFARRGYHDVKVSEIVSAAGLTQPAFYLYFSSKEAIFTELTQIFHQRMRMQINNSLLDSTIDKGDVFEQIKTNLKVFFDLLVADPDITRIGLFIDPNRALVRAEMVSVIQNNLVREQQAGYFRNDLDMGLVAESLMSIIERLTDTRLLSGLSNAEQLATQVVDLLFNGMVGG